MLQDKEEDGAVLSSQFRHFVSEGLYDCGSVPGQNCDAFAAC